MDELFIDQPVSRPAHPAALPDEALLKDCKLERNRRSGPGGQHRNKVETHVTLTHEPTGISGQAGERRSQEQNRKVALSRLRHALAVGVRVPVPAGDIRSEMWRQRTRDRKISCSPKHSDYPSMLAEALDVIEACGWELGKGGASTRLEVSASQLIKLIWAHKPAIALVNTEREKSGKRALRE